MANPNKKFFKPKEKPEFDQRTIDLARVTRVMAGGKRMRFRATIAIGDKKGRVGVGMAKGADVSLAMDKAVRQAKKAMINVPLVNGTIPHTVLIKDGATIILLKPAQSGTGIKTGGSIRVLMELAGITDVVGKIMGSNNRVNVVKAGIKALQSFKVDAKTLRNKAKADKPAEAPAK